VRPIHQQSGVLYFEHNLDVFNFIFFNNFQKNVYYVVKIISFNVYIEEKN